MDGIAHNNIEHKTKICPNNIDRYAYALCITIVQGR